MSSEPLVLKATATNDVLDDVHDLLRRFWLQNAPMPEGDRMRFELAVAEVAANIVRHCASPVELTLYLRPLEDGVSADFDETGDALPTDVIEAADDPDESAESGRGLILARTVLDEFSYTRVNGANHWRLVRRRHDE